MPTADIDDIVVAESLQGGGVIARYVAVELGLPEVPGLSDNRHCAAGLSAIQIAAASIMAGMTDVVVAGGTESISTSPSSSKRLALGQDAQPWMSPSHRETPDAPAFDMTITVGDNTAIEMGLTRRDVDEWAAYTHGQAVESIDNGWFESEIVPVEVPTLDGGTVTFSVDEHPRRGVTADSLGELKPLHPEIEGFTVTAGNAAGLNDAAAAVTVVSSRLRRGPRPHAAGPHRARGATPASSPPAPAWAPPSPSRRRWPRPACSVGDIDLWEVNEAFCSVPIAATAPSASTPRSST